MILRRGERQDVPAIGHDDEAGFFARQEFFDDHLIARGAELAAEHGLRSGDGFFRRVDDDHALAGGEPAGLDDDRRALPAHPLRIERLFAEGGIGRGGNAVALQEFLGIGLGALELRGGLPRSEAAQPCGRERIDHAEHQRTFRADDGEPDLFGFCQ